MGMEYIRFEVQACTKLSLSHLIQQEKKNIQSKFACLHQIEVYGTRITREWEYIKSVTGGIQKIGLERNVRGNTSNLKPQTRTELKLRHLYWHVRRNA